MRTVGHGAQGLRSEGSMRYGPPTRSVTLNLTALQRGAVLKDVDYRMF